MLIKRTNILFDLTMWEMLTSLAKSEEISVGELIREAIREKYMNNNKTEAKKAYEAIVKERKVSKEPINYKALIEHGRR